MNLASKLEEARKLLQKRLEEIDKEREQLTAALSQLDGLVETKPSSATRRATRRSGSRGSSGNGGRKRAPRGKREEQLLASIGEHPEFRVSDHARQVGVKPQQLYPILNRLVSRETIVKKDNKYALAKTE